MASRLVEPETELRASRTGSTPLLVSNFHLREDYYSLLKSTNWLRTEQKSVECRGSGNGRWVLTTKRNESVVGMYGRQRSGRSGSRSRRVPHIGPRVPDSANKSSRWKEKREGVTESRRVDRIEGFRQWQRPQNAEDDQIIGSGVGSVPHIGPRVPGFGNTGKLDWILTGRCRRSEWQGTDQKMEAQVSMIKRLERWWMIMFVEGKGFRRIMHVHGRRHRSRRPSREDVRVGVWNLMMQMQMRGCFRGSFEDQTRGAMVGPFILLFERKLEGTAGEECVQKMTPHDEGGQIFYEVGPGRCRWEDADVRGNRGILGFCGSFEDQTHGAMLRWWGFKVRSSEVAAVGEQDGGDKTWPMGAERGKTRGAAYGGRRRLGLGVVGQDTVHGFRHAPMNFEEIAAHECACARQHGVMVNQPSPWRVRQGTNSSRFEFLSPPKRNLTTPASSAASSTAL
ncbi:hypothetical protein B0H16DRAFT_1462805 [Mycena metata]|uniref:Uncharacterized protein n=1 Tax=Mycena metata TaxID=1033252 RepID=A0AAD7IL21_9AGAR|nr:hypothetical protein B0H16DRAFT_1462805 [Mycena metata]